MFLRLEYEASIVACDTAAINGTQAHVDIFGAATVPVLVPAKAGAAYGRPVASGPAFAGPAWSEGREREHGKGTGGRKDWKGE